MKYSIGNAPCSWGVEFADDPRNPPWLQVLQQCHKAGYQGIELGPIGYMPEDPQQVREALIQHNLTMIGGVVFRPFHDPYAWKDVLDGAQRTCKALQAHGAQHLVLIDSIAKERANTVARESEAVMLDTAQWNGLCQRIRTIATMASQEYGLTAAIHAHAGGFIDFEPELLRLLDEIDTSILSICFDTGHHSFAGYDPVAFMQKYMSRISYMHFKDINRQIKQHVIANKTPFYKACAQGVFCKLGEGEVNFVKIHEILNNANFRGWCTVEQDCDPTGKTNPFEDAQINRNYLHSIGF